MHERGVCGCPIYFPDLIKPRPSHRTKSDFGGDGHMDLRSTAGLPSLYGAEWVDEHRQLHKEGLCKCVGDFSCYKTPEVYRAAAIEAARAKEKSRAHTLKDLYPPSETGGLSPETRSLGEMGSTPKEYDTHFGPVRAAGSISEVDELRCTNPLFTFASKEGTKMKHSFVDCQTVEYPHPQIVKNGQGQGPNSDHAVVALVRPLVGLPIGAGPEAAPAFNHNGDFKCCVLHEQKEDDNLLDATVVADKETRLRPLLLRKSASLDPIPLNVLDGSFFFGSENNGYEDEEYWVTASVGDYPRENTGSPEFSDSDDDDDD